MATEQQTEEVPSSRPHRSGLLRQPEIEEVDEEDTSPGSDQSDTTITAGTFALNFFSVFFFVLISSILPVSF